MINARIPGLMQRSIRTAVLVLLCVGPLYSEQHEAAFNHLNGTTSGLQPPQRQYKLSQALDSFHNALRTGWLPNLPSPTSTHVDIELCRCWRNAPNTTCKINHYKPEWFAFSDGKSGHHPYETAFRVAHNHTDQIRTDTNILWAKEKVRKLLKNIPLRDDSVSIDPHLVYGPDGPTPTSIAGTFAQNYSARFHLEFGIVAAKWISKGLMLGAILAFDELVLAPVQRQAFHAKAYGLTARAPDWFLKQVKAL